MQLITLDDFSTLYINFDFDKLLIDNDNPYINDNNVYLNYKNAYINLSKTNFLTLQSLLSNINYHNTFNIPIENNNIIIFNQKEDSISQLNHFKFLYKQLLISQQIQFDNFIKYIDNLNKLKPQKHSPPSSIKSKKSIITKLKRKFK